MFDLKDENKKDNNIFFKKIKVKYKRCELEFFCLISFFSFLSNIPLISLPFSMKRHMREISPTPMPILNGNYWFYYYSKFWNEIMIHKYFFNIFYFSFFFSHHKSYYICFSFKCLTPNISLSKCGFIDFCLDWNMSYKEIYTQPRRTMHIILFL